MVGWPDVLLENVAALLDRGLGSILGAMAEIGYDTEWNCISAEAVGAPHQRDRLWILAHSTRERAQGLGASRQQEPCAHVIEELLMRGGERPINAEWDAEPVMGRVAHGVPDRAHRIKALGNSVVPQIITIIGEAYLRVRGGVK